MKFVKECTPEGLLLPPAAMRLAGLDDGGKAEYHTRKGALVVLKGQMTALELLAAAHSLHDLSVELNTHLAKVCGQCDGCGAGAENGGDGCPLMATGDAGLDLPEDLLREAGIPENAKLCAYVNKEASTVTIAAAGYDCDLRDIPQDTLEMFRAANVCLGELQERLIAEDTVYGS